MRSRLFGVLVVSGMTLAGCPHASRQAAAALQIAGDPGAVVNKVNDVPAQTPCVFELMSICSFKDASVITEVELIKPDNVTLVNWGVRAGSAVDSSQRVNGVPLNLTDLGGFKHDQVTASCANEDNATELGVTLIKGLIAKEGVFGV